MRDTSNLAAPSSAASPLDRSALERKALDYIGRYEAPASRITAVLRRMVEREARRQSIDREAALRMIDEVVADLVARGLIADHRYAGIRVRQLRDRGTGTSMIRQDLRARGVSATVVDDVLASETDPAAANLAAAIALARRRKLGPFRPAHAREENRMRDMAALARRGFDPELARRVIDAADISALEDEN